MCVMRSWQSSKLRSKGADPSSGAEVSSTPATRSTPRPRDKSRSCINGQTPTQPWSSFVPHISAASCCGMSRFGGMLSIEPLKNSPSRVVGSKLDERDRWVFAAGEVRAAGWGGLAEVSEITGLSRLLSSRDATLIEDLRGVAVIKQTRKALLAAKAESMGELVALKTHRVSSWLHAVAAFSVCPGGQTASFRPSACASPANATRSQWRTPRRSRRPAATATRNSQPTQSPECRTP
jgi:hypothetical protein